MPQFKAPRYIVWQLNGESNNLIQTLTDNNNNVCKIWMNFEFLILFLYFVFLLDVLCFYQIQKFKISAKYLAFSLS